MSEMAPEKHTECRCGRPTRDGAWLCDTCIEAFDRALGDCNWVDGELDVAITRQKGVNLNSGGSRSAETPLPWHDKASEAKRDLRNLLVLWVRYCRDENVRGRPTWQPQENIPSMSRYLLNCTHGLSLLDIGGDAANQITESVGNCQRIIFWKRRNRIYLGTCGQKITDDDGNTMVEACPGEMYAEEEADVGNCDDCGQGVTVVIRQAELNDQLDSRLYTAAELARMCVYLGLEAPRDTVRKKVHYWYRNKRIAAHGSDPAGDPMFRYGEVRTMLYAEFAQKIKS